MLIIFKMNLERPVSVSLQVCKSASLQVCKSAGLQVCRSASLQSAFVAHRCQLGSVYMECLVKCKPLNIYASVNN